MAYEGKTYFNIDSNLLFQLGEKLVTNRAVALAELVKNSYDADATYVKIEMKNVKNPGGTIIVEDNGLGMTLSTFEKTWMRIATTDKEENPISKKYKRRKAGEKGIGRFACRRLSRKLLLRSIAVTEKGVKEELSAAFVWPVFVPGSDIDKIPIEIHAKPVDDRIPTGTCLILEDTVEAWNEKDIKRLRSELKEVIHPATFKTEDELKGIPKEYDPGFEIDFECTDFPKEDKPLDSDFFKNSWARLSGFVDEKGASTYEVKVLNKILNKIEKNFERSSVFKYLKNTKLEIYIFSYRSDLFRGSEWKMRETREIAGERAGVKVYADIFRIFGYGEKGNDWLRIDYDRARSLVGVDKEVSKYAEEDKRPGLRLFRNHQLFGHVIFVRTDNPMLEITVNRDRLIENEAFEELRKFVRLGVDFATVLYSNEVYLDLKEKERQKEIEEIERRKAEEEARKKALEKLTEIEEATKKVEKESEEAEEIAEKTEEEREQAEIERREIEKRRREAEIERREIEEKTPTMEESEAKKRIEDAKRKEEELLKAEKEAIEREEEKKRKERKIKKKAKEKKKEAEKVRTIAYEERKKVDGELIKLEEKELKRKEEKLEQELSMLRVLASTGTLILIFEHELQALIEDMEEMNINFSQVIRNLSDKEQKNYNDVLESFNDRTEMVKELAELFGFTIGRESRLEKKEWVLLPVVERVFRPFKWYLKRSGIEYSESMPDNLRTPRMYRSELISILHNLMTNAIKAVKNEQDRRIEVKAFEEDGVVHILVLDSGKGLDKKLWGEVFEPFISYSEPDLRYGAGTGLGLKLVKDMVRSYEGEVHFMDAPDDWKTCIEVILPKR